MAETGAQSPQQIALQRLLQADADARSCQEQAHVQAMKILAEGEETARRLVTETRAAAEAEAKTSREKVYNHSEVEARQLRDQVQKEVDAMTQATQERLAGAAAFLVAWVKAEA